jgi:hypothetical protein
MPRRPIGDAAMTPAERARRYRARRRASPTTIVEQALETATRALDELWTALLHVGVVVADTADLRDRVAAARGPLSEIRIELIYRRRGDRITGPRDHERPAA